jgi:predicted dehydrogenase
MLQVGLIGLGADWEGRTRPAIEKLRHRLEVRSVYAPVLPQAEQAAAELGCRVAQGLLSLIERDDLRALLVFDGAWYGGIPAQFACRAGKPMFLAGSLLDHLALADPLRQRTADSGVTVMPAFGHRYTPATSRLRELIATRLGKPKNIRVTAYIPVTSDIDFQATHAATRNALATAIDWCTCVVGSGSASVRENTEPQRLYTQLEFRRTGSEGPSSVASIHVADVACRTGEVRVADTSPVRFHVDIDCADGRACVDGPVNLTWEAGGEQHTESLSADRPELEVMLDHFSRRAVGGLIPVPTLDDVCRAFELADAVLRGIT